MLKIVNRKNIEKGAVLIAYLMQMVVNYLLGLYIIRQYLSTEQIVTYQLISATINLVYVILAGAVPNLIVQKYLAKSEKHLSELKLLVIMQLGVTLLATTIFLLSNFWLSSLIPDQEVVKVVAVAAFSFIPYGIIFIFSSILNAKERYGLSTAIQILYIFLRVVTLLIFFRFYGLYALAYSPLLSTALIALPLFILAREDFSIIINAKSIDKKAFWSYLGESGKLAGFSFLSNYLLAFDLILFNRTDIDSTELGYYSLYSILARTPVYIVVGGMPFLWTELNKKRDGAGGNMKLLVLLLGILGLSLLSSVTIFIFGAPLLKLFISSSFSLPVLTMLLNCGFLLSSAIMYLILQVINAKVGKLVATLLFGTYFILTSIFVKLLDIDELQGGLMLFLTFSLLISTVGLLIIILTIYKRGSFRAVKSDHSGSTQAF